jgi:cob(I)alamin adenosyltransferase
MKIYTKQGDTGWSDLLGGGTAHKACDRFKALGDFDELNAWLGMIKCRVSKQESEFITQIQKDLIVLMSHVAALGGKDAAKYTFPKGLELELEKRIDELSKDRQESEFTLPGANEASAAVDVARTVCRRAERMLCTLGWEYPLSAETLKYINRLSDYLYVLSVYVGTNSVRP